MNILEVQNLCKTYGKGEAQVRALDNVSFSVGKGEFIAIVGESGSGKSTLLNVVGALDNPTSGKVLIDGKDIFSMPEKKLTVFRRQNIGFIFQSFNLIPELNVEQNITFPLLLDYQKPDQPTGNLDSKNSQEVITLLKSMSAKYRQTILMITHNENHADATDRVLRMTDGRLRDLGVAAR